MKTLLHVAVAILFGGWFIFATLMEFPPPKNSLAWWWEISFAILAIGIGSYGALYTRQFVERNHQAFKRFSEKQAGEFLKPHMFAFAKAIGVVFILLGVALFGRNLFLPTVEEYCANYVSEVYEGSYEKCLTDNGFEKLPGEPNDLSLEDVSVASTTIEHIKSSTKGEVEVLKTGELPAENSEWALVVPILSINTDVVIKREPWMVNPAAYDQELTALEEKQKENFQTQQAGMKLIIESVERQDQFVLMIEESIASVAYDRDRLLKEKAFQEEFLVTVSEGQNLDSIEGRAAAAKLQATTEALIEVMEDIDNLAGLLIKIKQATIEATQKRDVVRMGVAANDEDTTSLLISWHWSGLEKLKAEQKTMVDAYKN